MSGEVMLSWRSTISPSKASGRGMGAAVTTAKDARATALKTAEERILGGDKWCARNEMKERKNEVGLWKANGLLVLQKG